MMTNLDSRIGLSGRKRKLCDMQKKEVFVRDGTYVAIDDTQRFSLVLVLFQGNGGTVSLVRRGLCVLARQA